MLIIRQFHQIFHLVIKKNLFFLYNLTLIFYVISNKICFVIQLHFDNFNKIQPISVEEDKIIILSNIF